MNYQIRYQHTSWSKESSKTAALKAVKNEAGVNRLFTVECDDGTYCYKSQADKDRDTDGSRAFAVICSPTQQNN